MIAFMGLLLPEQRERDVRPRGDLGPDEVDVLLDRVRPRRVGAFDERRSCRRHQPILRGVSHRPPGGSPCHTAITLYSDRRHARSWLASIGVMDPSSSPIANTLGL